MSYQTPNSQASQQLRSMETGSSESQSFQSQQQPLPRPNPTEGQMQRVTSFGVTPTSLRNANPTESAHAWSEELLKDLEEVKVPTPGPDGESRQLSSSVEGGTGAGTPSIDSAGRTKGLGGTDGSEEGDAGLHVPPQRPQATQMNSAQMLKSIPGGW